MLKAGCVEAVIYFVKRGHGRGDGHPFGFIMLAPFTSFPTPEGYERCGAETLSEIDKLQSRLTEQEYMNRVGELMDDEARYSAARQRVYDDLYSRMHSAATSDYEKEFIRGYLKLSDQKREKYHKRFLCDTAVWLHAREMDTGKRRVDQERWNGTADLAKGNR